MKVIRTEITDDHGTKIDNDLVQVIETSDLQMFVDHLELLANAVKTLAQKVQALENEGRYLR